MTATTARHRVLGHVISAEQFDRELLDHLFLRATALADVRDDRLAHRVMATLFYEPSNIRTVRKLWDYLAAATATDSPEAGAGGAGSRGCCSVIPPRGQG